MGYGQYQDYFVDALASGAGDGSTPTDASTFLSNNSVFTTNVTSSMIRAWVRRTHVETVPLNANIGASNAQASSRRQFIIGWPSSGDPFYNERPAAGISAGWDADNSARAIKTTYGLNFPTLTSSAGGLRFRQGTILANMNLDYVNSSNIGNVMANMADESVYADNIVFTNRDGPTRGLINTNVGWRFGKLTVINTPSGPAFAQINSFAVDQIVIHSMSAVNSGVIQTAGQPANWYVGEIINYSNSVDYLLGGSDRSPAHGIGHVIANYIGRAAGVKPYSGWNGFVGPFKQNGTFTSLFRCDDYFGEGPVTTNGAFSQMMRLASSAEAMYESARAVFIECSSWGGGWPHYGRPSNFMRPVRKLFDVLSGSTLTIFQPVYVDSTAVWSLANGTGMAWLRALGCAPQFITGSHLITGSLDNWGGSKKGGGVAWTIATTFTPQETGTVIYECALPTLILSADMGCNAYLIYGEPWAV